MGGLQFRVRQLQREVKTASGRDRNDSGDGLDRSSGRLQCIRKQAVDGIYGLVSGGPGRFRLDGCRSPRRSCSHIGRSGARPLLLASRSKTRRAFVALRMGNIAGFWLAVCLCAISTERFVRWYGILTDIEDRKRAEEERERLRQLEADLAHINRVSMMGELAASIAHEVNQPLSGHRE